MRFTTALATALFVMPATASAQEADADELAQALANPLATLVSVPLQYNYDETFGDEGHRHTLNIQPVIPASISSDWNMISRTIIPVIAQKDVVPGTDQSGLGDTAQSIFFSPKEPTASGWIWGVGPAALLPTGTDDLGNDTWALGPTAVFLKQASGWTYGALINHLVDVGGDTDIRSTFLQPFLARILRGGRTVTLNAEASYDWEAEQWTAPLNLMYSKVTTIGGQMVSYQVGARGYLDKPDDGPDWGLRFTFTLLYPK